MLQLITAASLPEDGICNPPANIHPLVVKYYCAVLNEASKKRSNNTPWEGHIDGGLKWIDTACDIVKNMTFSPGKTSQILTKFMCQNLSYTTKIGIELMNSINVRDIAIFGLYTTMTFLPTCVDIKFIESIAILITNLMAQGKRRDAGKHITELCDLIPNHLVDMAWSEIASITKCNPQRIQLMKYVYEQVMAIRGSTLCRDIAKTKAFENYPKYLEIRLLDGIWRFSNMCCLAYETGNPETADSTATKKISESSLIFVEECSRARRKIYDENFGYWSLLNEDERKARNWGRHRMSMFYRQGWDECNNWAELWVARSAWRYNSSGIPGSGTWLAFNYLI
jgi:hypothetical protein